MFIRLILIVFLLVMSAMPAFANDKEQELPAAIQELMKAGIDLYEEEVLTNLQIEAKDRLEGDTYYIDFTITNPTNTQLNKKISLTTITYDLCHADDPYQSVTQSVDTISELNIEPFSTYTTTISLKQPIPVQFNHLSSFVFLFEDNSSLHYNTMGESAPTSAFRLFPIASPFGDVSLKIQNISATETITELRDIRLNFTIGQHTQKMIFPDPIALEVKPNESYTLPLYTLSSDNTQASSPFSLNAKTANATRTYSYHINMKINGIPHTYFDNSTDAIKMSGSSKNTFIDTPTTHFQFPPKKNAPKK